MGDIGSVSNIVWVASGIGIIDRETSSNLSKGVGFWLSFSFSLAIVKTMTISKSMGDIGSVSNIVGVSSGIGIGNRETSSNLSKGVGFSFSFSLAIVETMMTITDSSDHTWVMKTTIKSSVVKRQTSSNLANGPGFSITLAIISMMDSIHSSVANGSNSTDKTMAIVYTSDNTSRVSITIGNLSNGVWVTTDTGNSSKDLVLIKI